MSQNDDALDEDGGGFDVDDWARLTPFNGAVATLDDVQAGKAVFALGDTEEARVRVSADGEPLSAGVFSFVRKRWIASAARASPRSPTGGRDDGWRREGRGACLRALRRTWLGIAIAERAQRCTVAGGPGDACGWTSLHSQHHARA